MPCCSSLRRAPRKFSSTPRSSTPWHPLDGVPAPDYVPPTWDGPHVGKRLVDGLRTLMLMPAPSGPRMFGNHWPVYAHDWADLLAQQEADAEQRQRDQREANRTRVRAAALDPKRTLRI
jgi:hypothetical protein